MKLHHLAMSHITSKIEELKDRFEYLGQRSAHLLSEIYSAINAAKPPIESQAAVNAALKQQLYPRTKTIKGREWYLARFEIPVHDRGEGDFMIKLPGQKPNDPYFSIAVPADHPILPKIESLVGDLIKTNEHRTEIEDRLERLEDSLHHMGQLEDHDEEYEVRK